MIRLYARAIFFSYKTLTSFWGGNVDYIYLDYGAVFTGFRARVLRGRTPADPNLSGPGMRLPTASGKYIRNVACNHHKPSSRPQRLLCRVQVRARAFPPLTARLESVSVCLVGSGCASAPGDICIVQPPHTRPWPVRP